MIARRAALIGGACALSLGAAEWLRPRRTMSLLGNVDIDQIIPRAFASWVSTPGGDFVLPQSGNSLAVKLYAEQLMRVYSSAEHMMSIMLLIAYGGTQSDALQLHRPESCYPAVGLPITYRAQSLVPLANGVAVPGMALTAQASERIEDIVYWTRLGEYLPQSAEEQRRDRLLIAMRGYVADGLLVRASALRQGGESHFPTLIRFLGDLIRSTAPANRSALIGSDLTMELNRAGAI